MMIECVQLREKVLGIQHQYNKWTIINWVRWLKEYHVQKQDLDADRKSDTSDEDDFKSITSQEDEITSSDRDNTSPTP